MELLHKKANKASDFGQLLKTLDNIHLELIEYLEKEIVAHEKYLAGLENLNEGLLDVAYRNEHKRLGESMALFIEDIKAFKMMIFGYAKKL